MHLRLRLILIFFSIFVITSCDSEKTSFAKLTFNNIDITGADYAKDFLLNDHNGKKRKISDFKEKIVVVFFGFTYCPDVCPTTLFDLAKVKNELDKYSDLLQVIFITLDPERDTPSILAKYVPSFDQTFLSLYGDLDEIKKIAKDFKIFFQKVQLGDGKNYTIDHTSGSYVFDTKGNVRLFIRHGVETAKITEDIKKLIENS